MYVCVCVWLDSSLSFKHVWLNDKGTFCPYNFIKILSSFGFRFELVNEFTEIVASALISYDYKS